MTKYDRGDLLMINREKGSLDYPYDPKTNVGYRDMGGM